jgi:hypothetical protein
VLFLLQQKTIGYSIKLYNMECPYFYVEMKETQPVYEKRKRRVVEKIMRISGIQKEGKRTIKPDG